MGLRGRLEPGTAFERNAVLFTAPTELVVQSGFCNLKSDSIHPSPRPRHELLKQLHRLILHEPPDDLNPAATQLPELVVGDWQFPKSRCGGVGDAGAVDDPVAVRPVDRTEAH